MFPRLVVNREPRLPYYATLESKPTAQNLPRYHVLNESQCEADDLAKFMNSKKKCYSDAGKTTNSWTLAYCLVPTALNSITKNILLETFWVSESSNVMVQPRDKAGPRFSHTFTASCDPTSIPSIARTPWKLHGHVTAREFCRVYHPSQVQYHIPISIIMGLLCVQISCCHSILMEIRHCEGTWGLETLNKNHDVTTSRLYQLETSFQAHLLCTS